MFSCVVDDVVVVVEVDVVDVVYVVVDDDVGVVDVVLLWMCV